MNESLAATEVETVWHAAASDAVRVRAGCLERGHTGSAPEPDVSAAPTGPLNRFATDAQCESPRLNLWSALSLNCHEANTDERDPHT